MTGNSTTQDVLEENFYLKNDEYSLRLDETTLSWSAIQNKSGVSAKNCQFKVEFQDILTVCSAGNDHYFLQSEHLTKKKSKTANSWSILDVSNIKSCHSFEIHYVVPQLLKCKTETITFCHSDLSMVTKWIDTLRLRVEKVTNRPKSLLVFVNPFSGRKRGLEIYEKFVEPLFRLISVRVTLVTTQHTNHSYDYLLENGWHNVDGIVSVGGDGTFLEMMNGVIARTAKDSDINLDDSSVKIPSPLVRIGVIPAGSTDAIAYSLHGTADIQTAVIHVISGDFMKTDVCSVHSEKNFLCCFIGIISYGYLGDVIKNSVNLRWMGPMRYDCVGKYAGISKIPQGLIS